MALVDGVRTEPNGIGELGHLGSPRRWQGRYVTLTVVSDSVLLAASVLLADAVTWSRLGGLAPITLLTPGLWLIMNAAFRVYDQRFIGVGSEEYRRLVRAAFTLVATVILAFFTFGIEISRAFVGISATVGLGSTLVARYLARRRLHNARRIGRNMQRVLAVGDGAALVRLIHSLRTEHRHGMQIVGACVAQPGSLTQLPTTDVTVLGGLSDVAAVAALAAVEVVAVTTGPGVDQGRLRQLAWELERSGVELVVEPNLMEFAGPRTHVRPVCGLALLHVEQPRFSGAAAVLKACFDRVVAAVALILLAPFLLAIGLAVRWTSTGPALFRQHRVGRNGREFTMLKFRTMCVDAEDRRAELAQANDCSDGLLFKVRVDPRVTRVGRVLRRTSLDELPQLLNVLTGSMSLVGPRPALPAEVARYGGDMRRRMLIKPGLTGLWQVSGRSDLTWEESVRLDLRYVENWSFSLDLFILAKTVLAVTRPSGAY